MQYYMVRCVYTSAAWRELLSAQQKSAEDRISPVRALAKKFGGDFVRLAEEGKDGQVVYGKFIGFGSDDLIGIVKMPSPSDARAFSMVISSHEGVRNFEITPLLTFDEGVEAMRKGHANQEGYWVPGDSKG